MRAWVMLLIPIISYMVAMNVVADEKKNVSAEHTLRWYPSAQLAPVRELYIFYWDFGKGPEFDGAVANAQGVNRHVSWEEVRNKGRLPLRWTYGPQQGSSEQEFVDRYVDLMKSGQLGIMVDEWQSPRTIRGGKPILPGEPLHPDDPFGITGSIKGMIESKRINPAFFIAVAWRGEDSIQPAVRAGLPDLLLIEGFTHIGKKSSSRVGMRGIKRRIDKARELDVLDRTICWLGMFRADDDYRNNNRLTPEIFELLVAEIRQYAPEMPGLAFYHNANEKLATACDKITRKYFVEPAPEVSLVSPEAQQTISLDHVVVRAKAIPKNGQTIREYRWFVDNRWVATTAKPIFRWDTRSLENGVHYMTVHAIDSGWNRAAAQVPVIVNR